MSSLTARSEGFNKARVGSASEGAETERGGVLGSLVSTDNACLPVVMSLENPVFAGKGGLTRRKGGGSLIKRNLVVRGREIAATPVTIGVWALFMTDLHHRRGPVYICAHEIGLKSPYY